MDIYMGADTTLSLRFINDFDFYMVKNMDTYYTNETMLTDTLTSGNLNAILFSSN
jgi:hypothetical protein